jgi:hypothetical protein
MTQVVQHLPSKHDILSSVPNTTKKKKRERERSILIYFMKTSQSSLVVNEYLSLSVFKTKL